MSKKTVIILVVTLVILVVGLLAFGEIDAEKEVKEHNGLIQMESGTKNDNVEEVQTNKNALDFGVNQQYTDPKFLITLKKEEFKDNVVKFNFNILNINEEETSLDYSLFKCIVNKQSVDVLETGTISIGAKEKKSVDISCSSESDDVYLTYLSTMFDGEEVIANFGK